jgi:hypothetical protein
MRTSLMLLLLLISTSRCAVHRELVNSSRWNLSQVQAPHLIPASLMELPFGQTCLVDGPRARAWVH